MPMQALRQGCLPGGKRSRHFSLAACADTTGEANIGNDQTVAIRQRAALEPLFYAGGSQNHVDAVFYGGPPTRILAESLALIGESYSGS